MIDGGGYAIAVSLDIRNAFNSIPWRVIHGALESRGFPHYIRRILADYGPLLWNIAFDSVLRLNREEGCHTVCYADDTLLVATSDRLFDAIVKANVQIARVCGHVSSLGLSIAVDKTEAVLFSRKARVRMPFVNICGTRVSTKDSMKYLGVMIDGGWKFARHFCYVGEKIARVSRTLLRLMPNLRGPDEQEEVVRDGTNLSRDVCGPGLV